MARHSNAKDINVYQVANNTSASLQTDSEVITDTIRNKTTKLTSELAKGAIDKAEQALNGNKNGGANNPTTIVTTHGNLSEATDVSKYSDQLVDHGGKQRLSNTIDTYGERIKHQLLKRLGQRLAGHGLV